MKKPFTLLLVWMITMLPFSCRDEYCGSSDRYEVYMEDMTLKFGSYNGGSFYELSEQFKGLSHQVFTLVLEVSESIVKVSDVGQQASTFISTANACDPNPSKIVNKISDLLITGSDTLYLSGTKLSPGSSLNQFFYIPTWDCSESGTCSANQLINSDPNLWSYQYGNRGNQIFFQLIEAPDSLVKTIFRFEVSLDDGKEFNLSIGPVLID